ncbi:MAG: hypothetical protein DMG41_22585 [Acidobacteria bacterium]|nr:MAG: hypothetical protein DMG41_22585 [Acidobacteriota bacterium]
MPDSAHNGHLGLRKHREAAAPFPRCVGCNESRTVGTDGELYNELKAKSREPTLPQPFDRP